MASGYGSNNGGSRANRDYQDQVRPRNRRRNRGNSYEQGHRVNVYSEGNGNTPLGTGFNNYLKRLKRKINQLQEEYQIALGHFDHQEDSNANNHGHRSRRRTREYRRTIRSHSTYLPRSQTRMPNEGNEETEMSVGGRDQGHLSRNNGGKRGCGYDNKRRASGYDGRRGRTVCYENHAKNHHGHRTESGAIRRSTGTSRNRGALSSEKGSRAMLQWDDDDVGNNEAMMESGYSVRKSRPRVRGNKGSARFRGVSYECQYRRKPLFGEDTGEIEESWGSPLLNYVVPQEKAPAETSSEDSDHHHRSNENYSSPASECDSSNNSLRSAGYLNKNYRRKRDRRNLNYTDWEAISRRRWNSRSRAEYDNRYKFNNCDDNVFNHTEGQQKMTSEFGVHYDNPRADGDNSTHDDWESVILAEIDSRMKLLFGKRNKELQTVGERTKEVPRRPLSNYNNNNVYPTATGNYKNNRGTEVGRESRGNLHVSFERKKTFPYSNNSKGFKEKSNKAREAVKGNRGNLYDRRPSTDTENRKETIPTVVYHKNKSDGLLSKVRNEDKPNLASGNCGVKGNYNIQLPTEYGDTNEAARADEDNNTQRPKDGIRRKSINLPNNGEFEGCKKLMSDEKTQGEGEKVEEFRNCEKTATFEEEARAQRTLRNYWDGLWPNSNDTVQISSGQDAIGDSFVASTEDKKAFQVGEKSFPKSNVPAWSKQQSQVKLASNYSDSLRAGADADDTCTTSRPAIVDNRIKFNNFTSPSVTSKKVEELSKWDAIVRKEETGNTFAQKLRGAIKENIGLSHFESPPLLESSETPFQEYSDGSSVWSRLTELMKKTEAERHNQNEENKVASAFSELEQCSSCCSGQTNDGSTANENYIAETALNKEDTTNDDEKEM